MSLGERCTSRKGKYYQHSSTLVIFALVVTEESGLGHTTSSKRLNVSVTRHSDGLFVVGDMLRASKTERVVVTEDGGYEGAAVETLHAMLDWFQREQRGCLFDGAVSEWGCWILPCTVVY